MKSAICFVTVCAILTTVLSLNLPGPLVYVVTPKTLKPEAGRSAPFYYHNWMRRMDPPRNATTTTTTTSSPDLIFAEFEAENGDDKRKSLRKLLEKERIDANSSTMKPLYVPDEVTETLYMQSNGNEPPAKEADGGHVDKSSSYMEDYFSAYNNAYNQPAPVFLPSTTTKKPTTKPPTTTSTTEAAMNVENIWHIIDNEKYNTGKWEEVPAEESDAPDPNDENKSVDENQNFSLPGFKTNPGNGENESRAIRTEPNLRFPYVNLKTFQMKNPKSGSKKGNNMFMNLDNLRDISNPVSGEAQDFRPMREPVDRYNPAQPYLPDYGTKSKPSNPVATPSKTMSNLVPPPPPPSPPPASAAFPLPSSYDSFPPYAPSDQSSPPAPAPDSAYVPAKPPPSIFQPPSDDSDFPPDSSDDGPPMDVGYRYKQPAFLPTIPPPALSKPFGGYTYNKPVIESSYKPMDSKPLYEAPPDEMEKPHYGGYHYNKPIDSPLLDDLPKPPTYGPHEHHHGSNDHDFPELIYDKPGHGGMKDGGPPMDHGFPQDFPGNFEYHDDHDDHDDHDVYHYHHPTTSTTTTETPRVNRYSYYYLGKKLYYLPLYFSVYFIVYVGALIIKAVLRHKIVYPNSWRPNNQQGGFFTKRSADSWDLSNDRLHEITGVVTKALSTAAEKYMSKTKSS